MSVCPSVSQESPRNNGDGNFPAWGVEVGWRLINVQKIESKCPSYFWLLCLSGGESWVGKEGRRWIKGKQKAPGTLPHPQITPSFCARELVPRDNVWLLKQKRKKIQKRKEIANHLQRMHEIISALNWQTTIVLRGKFSTKCASYQTAKITM